MTPDQRMLLERIAEAAPVVMTDNVEAAVSAALADLDACRAALQPVAGELREEQFGTATNRHDISGIFRAAYLTDDEAAAVLAAAGSEKPAPPPKPEPLRPVTFTKGDWNKPSE